MKRPQAFLIICFFCNASASGLDDLNRFTRDLRTFEAQFEQSTLDTENSRQGLFRGNFWLERPNKFRWDYLSPTEKNIIADGNDLWIIDHELDQVSQYYQPWALENTPISILLSTEMLFKTFKVIELGKKKEMMWFELLPNDSANEVMRILLAFQNGNLIRLEVTDNFGQISRFSFSEIKRNSKIPKSIFEYKPPEDLDVFYQDL